MIAFCSFCFYTLITKFRNPKPGDPPSNIFRISKSDTKKNTSLAPLFLSSSLNLHPPSSNSLLVRITRVLQMSASSNAITSHRIPSPRLIISIQNNKKRHTPCCAGRSSYVVGTLSRFLTYVLFSCAVNIRTSFLPLLCQLLLNSA